jgi:hypothetical protein
MIVDVRIAGEERGHRAACLYRPLVRRMMILKKEEAEENIKEK